MRQLYLFIAFLILPYLIAAQNCGIPDTLIHPFEGDTAIYQLEVFDVVNDDLSDAAQGVCSIDIAFLNNEVSALEVWMVSPNQDTVQLIGPKVDNPFGTLLGFWDISFLNEAITPTASPDFPFGDRFDNALNTYTPDVDYQGAYFPYQGSLADFASGPVNGTWTLIVHYLPQFWIFPGANISAFQIQFCDSRGYDCCFADAGRLPELGPIIACEEDSVLQFSIDPLYDSIAPDTAIYAHTNIISLNGLIVDYNESPDFRQFPPGTYQVCALSYQKDQIDSLPKADSTFSLVDLQNNLSGFFPTFCAALSDSCLSLTILEKSDTTFLGDIFLCGNDSLQIGDTVLSNSGNFNILLQNQMGCDSIVSVNLNINPISIDTLEESACPGIPHLSATGVELDTSGYYTFSYTSTSNCDSIVVIDFTRLDFVVNLEGDQEVLSCKNPQVTLSASTTAPAEEVTFRWEVPPFGNVISTDSILTVTEPGTFFLQPVRVKNGISCGGLRLGPINIAGDFDAPLSDAGPADSLSCNLSSLNLDGTNSQMGNEIRYHWFTNDGGQISNDSILQPSIDQVGTYFLELTDTMNGCKDTSAVVIGLDTFPPTINIINDTTLFCSPGFLRLFANTVPENEPADYFWTSASGRAISQADTSAPIIDYPDTFSVQVSSRLNGCINTAEVIVQLDTAAPEINIDVSRTLIDCQVQQISLDASGSDSGGSIVFEWDVSNGGNIMSGGQSLVPTVNAAGTYELVLRDTLNNCTSSEIIEIQDTSYTVIANLQQNGNLNCNGNPVILDALNSTSGPNIEYQWTDLNNGAFTGLVADSVSLSLAGNYQLVVFDVFTKCVGIANISISSDTIKPIAQAGPDQELSCADSIITLSAINPGPNTQILWSGPCVISDPGQDSIMVDCPGFYILELQDTLNFCSDRDTVEVFVNPVTPNVQIEDTIAINCSTGLALLDASGSSGGKLEWYFGGSLIDSLRNSIEVDRPGIYNVRVFNDTLSCSDERSVLVLQDCKPQIILGALDTLNCLDTVITIDASASLGENLGFRWMGPNPNCITGDTTAMNIQATCPGVYQLILSNSLLNEADTISFEIFQDITPPLAAAGRDTTLDCSQSFISYDARIGSTLGYVNYQWLDLDRATILPGAAILAETGTYILEVQNNLNFCIARDTVLVTGPAIPEFEIIQPETLTCADTLVELRINLFMPKDSISYNWTTTGSEFITNPNDTMLVVANPGLYRLELTDLENACTFTDSIDVFQDLQSPSAEAGPDQTVGCVDSLARLDGSNSDMGIEVEYLWLEPSPGAIIAGQNTDTPLVAALGTYQLVALNVSTGCFTTDFVTVLPPAPLPALNNFNDIQLSCAEPTQEISSGIPNIMNYDVQWYGFANNGDTILNSQDTSILVQEAGSYTFRITDRQSRCTDTISFRVESNVERPAFQILEADTLSCDLTSINLSIDTLLDINAFSYEWFDQFGAPLSSNSSVGVNSPGAYSVLLTNLSTGCSASDTVMVFENITPPEIQILGENRLTCLNDTILLLASSNENNINFMWGSISGNFIGDIDGSSIQVTGPGVFNLEAQSGRNGCISEAEIEVLEDKLAPQLNMDTSNLILTCLNPNLVLDASASLTNSGLPPSFNWSGGSINSQDASINISQSQSLSLSLVDPNNGCSSDFDFFIGIDTSITQFDLQKTNDLSCTLASATLNADLLNPSNELQFTWLDELGSVQGNSLAIDLNSAGTYQFQVENTSNGCSRSAFIDLDFQGELPLINLELLSNLDCDNDFAEVQVSSSNFNINDLMINWSTSDGSIVSGQEEAILRIGEAGVYEVEVTDGAANCVSFAQINIEREGRKIGGATIDLQMQECDADSPIMLQIGNIIGGTSPFLYSLNRGAFESSSQFSVNGGTEQNLTIQDANGCEWDTVFSIENLVLPKVELGRDITIQRGDSVNLEAEIASNNYSSIRWIFNNVEVQRDELSFNTGPLFQTQTYTVIVEGADNCNFEDQVRIFVEERELVYFPNVFSPNDDGINDFYVPGFNDQVLRVNKFMIFDRWGEIVFSIDDLNPTDNQLNWDGERAGSPAASGVYIYRMEIELSGGIKEEKVGAFVLIR